jgi:hypothetical protein
MVSGLFVMMALLTVSRGAAAEAVFVVSVDDPSRDTRRLLAPYLDEMAHHPNTLVLPSDFRARLGSTLPRSGLGDPGLRLPDLIAEYEAGFESFRNRQWQDAARRLEAARDKAHRNTALLIDRPSYRDIRIRGQLLLAMSLYRMKKIADADAIIEDLARTFPNQEIAIKAISGTESAEYYAAAQNRLVRRGPGGLVVEVNDQSALVYLDEDSKPQNAALEAEVLPGPHRVLVRLPGTDGQLYDIDVEPGRVTRLVVDLKFGDALTVTDQYASLVFPSQDERRKYALEYAYRLAVAADAGLEMILVERTTWHGQPAMTSTVYFTDSGAWVRGRVVVLDGQNDDDKMRALARETLRGRIEDQRVFELVDPAMAQIAKLLAPARRHGWKTWTAGAGAAIALAGGAGLLYLHETCASDAEGCSPSAVPGYAGLAVGVALGGLATYLFFSDGAGGGRKRMVSVLPVRRGATIGLSLAF